MKTDNKEISSRLNSSFGGSSLQLEKSLTFLHTNTLNFSILNNSKVINLQKIECYSHSKIRKIVKGFIQSSSNPVSQEQKQQILKIIVRQIDILSYKNHRLANFLKETYKQKDQDYQKFQIVTAFQYLEKDEIGLYKKLTESSVYQDKLLKLNFWGQKINSNRFFNLKIQNLLQLEMKYCQLVDEDLCFFIKRVQNFPLLRYFDLGNNRIKSVKYSQLKELRQNSFNLHAINLSTFVLLQNLGYNLLSYESRDEVRTYRQNRKLFVILDGEELEIYMKNERWKKINISIIQDYTVMLSKSMIDWAEIYYKNQSYANWLKELEQRKCWSTLFNESMERIRFQQADNVWFQQLSSMEQRFWQPENNNNNQLALQKISASIFRPYHQYLMQELKIYSDEQFSQITFVLIELLEKIQEQEKQQQQLRIQVKKQQSSYYGSNQSIYKYSLLLSLASLINNSSINQSQTRLKQLELSFQEVLNKLSNSINVSSQSLIDQIISNSNSQIISLEQFFMRNTIQKLRSLSREIEELQEDEEISFKDNTQNSQAFQFSYIRKPNDSVISLTKSLPSCRFIWQNRYR